MIFRHKATDSRGHREANEGVIHPMAPILGVKLWPVAQGMNLQGLTNLMEQ